MTTPTPPTNVRLVDDLGIEHPVQCIYLGQDRGGMAVWQVVEAPPVGFKGIKVERLPGRTTVRLHPRWVRRSS